MELPVFKYHPDPLATGSVEKSAKKCKCCGRKNGYIYVGPVYAEEDDLDGTICPRCIADGSAAEKFDASFVDPAGIGANGVAVSQEVEEEISCRTPGFSGWQQEQWPGCCEDAAAFLGPMGRAELEKVGEAAIEAVRQESSLEGPEWDKYFHTLDREGGPTAYLFRCLHCGSFLAYSDCH